MSYRPFGPPTVNGDEGVEQKLKRLQEIYAIRARALSDAVAAFGREIAQGKSFDEKILEIKRLRALSERAGADFLDFIGQQPGRSGMSGFARRPPGSRPASRLR